MTSMEPTYDSNSPEMRPSSIASSPSTKVDSARPAANPQRAQNVKRTYGRKVALDVPPTAEAPQKEEKRALKRQSTEIVPETEFDAPHSESTSEEDVTERRRTAVTSSSPSRRNVHSTDPTSEDSGSDGEEEVGGLEAFLNKKSIAEQLAALDDQFDADDALPIPPTQFHRQLNQPASSSSLPHLTTSEDAPSRNASSSHNTPSARPLAAPSSMSILDEIEAALPRLPSPPQDDEESEQPVQRSKKPVARIVDSEDEDEAELALKPSRKSKQRVVDFDSDSSARDAGSVTRSSSPVRPTLSAKEKVAALAAKKRKEAPPAEEKKKAIYEDVEDMIDGDDESDGGNKKKRSGRKAGVKKTKSLSKKVEDEMNRQTAAFARTADVRLQATRKTVLSVADIAKQVTKEPYLPTPPVTNPNPPKSATVTLGTSSDAIADSSPATAGPSRPRPALSFKALGKQRESSPIFELDATPVPRRDPSTPMPLDWSAIKKKTAAPVEPLVKDGGQKEDSDDGDELVSLDAMLDKHQRKKEEEAKQKEEARLKEEKKQLLLAKKKAALAAMKAKAVAAAPDSDSDIEIEGMPGAAKKRSSSSNGKKRDVFEIVKSETPQRGASVNRIFRQFAGVDIAHPPDEDEEPTESQFEAAGKEFGRNLDPKQHHIPTPARTGKTAKSKSSSRRTANAPPITLESLDHKLLHQVREQNQKIRIKKQDKYYREQRRAAENGGEIEGVNVKELLEKKKKQADEDEAMEEDEDGEYRDEEEEEEDEAASAGSGSDAEFGFGSGSDAPSRQDERRKEGEEGEEEEEVDSDGGLRMPPSSQNSDRLGKAPANEAGDEDDEEESMPPPAMKRSKPAKRLIFDHDEEEESQQQPTPAATATKSASTTPAPTEVAPTVQATVAEAVPLKLDGLFGGADAGGDGGFSQFFDSQFSQDAAGGEAQPDGFLRPANDDFAAPASTMFVGQPLISTAERNADAALLEKRGGFNDFEPGTPREAPAVRQYINQQGFLTQTRPANLFADSPSDSPAFSFRQTLSTRDSESQLGGDTQLQTPTQASKDPTRLRRLDAMVTYGSLPATELQPAATEVVRSAASRGEEVAETQDAEETQEESFPTAAQPPSIAAPIQHKNAFDALRAGAAQEAAPPPAPKEPKRRGKSAFVDAEANLSDEEDLGLGGVSGDEDETGLDAELESLVDNEEVDKELRDEQDALVDELHAAEMEKKHEEDLKRAQRIADGKERQKRKGFDLSDDEFDDDYIRRRGDRAKKRRMDSLTTEQLKANEETQAFAAHLTDACVATSKTNEYSFLDAAEHSDLDEDDDGYDEQQESAGDVFGAFADAPPAIKTTFKEAQALALRKQQELQAQEEDDEDELMVDLDGEVGYGGDGGDFHIHLGGSSSPVAPFKLNNRIVEAKTTVVRAQVDEYEEIDSQYSLFRQDSVQAVVQYKAGDGREESQSAAIAGGRSAVTSFKRSAPGKSTSSSGLGSAGSKGKSGTTLGPKASKFGALRKSGFA